MTTPNSNQADEKLMNAILQFNHLYRFNKTHLYDESKKINFENQCVRLKHSEMMLLFYIRHCVNEKKGGVTATELSEEMNVKPPTINPLIANLEKSGLIERKHDEHDRRFVKIELTKEGHDLTQHHIDSFVKKIHGLADYLGEDKSNQLAGLMNDVYEYLSTHRTHDR